MVLQPGNLVDSESRLLNTTFKAHDKQHTEE